MKSLELRTDGMSSDGTAVGREPSGRVVFVTGALPGEVVRVELEAERARHASGRAVEVLEPAAGRVSPPCRHVAEGCGGCQWQHADPAAQIGFKEQIVLDAIQRIGRIADPPVRPSVELAPWAYRTTLRAGVHGGRAALRPARSNELVDVEGCLIVHPLLGDLLQGARYGGAAEVVLRCGARTGERLVATDPPDAPVDVPPDVRRDHFHEHAAGRTWRVSARSFFQTRPDGVDALAALVGAAASEGGRVGRAWDLYSGVGLFAGLLAAGGWEVTAVEGSAPAVRDARHNLRGAGVRVVHSDVSRWSPDLPADLVVADPSRAGLGRPGTRLVAGSGATRLVLISCDAASLGRDAGLLAEAGFKLTSVTPVDLFPHSFHVEVVSVFDRIGGR